MIEMKTFRTMMMFKAAYLLRSFSLVFEAESSTAICSLHNKVSQSNKLKNDGKSCLDTMTPETIGENYIHYRAYSEGKKLEIIFKQIDSTSRT